jgi:hypothetical protein
VVRSVLLFNLELQPAGYPAWLHSTIGVVAFVAVVAAIAGLAALLARTTPCRLREEA